MYMVFWFDGEKPQSQPFPSDALSLAVTACEEKRRAGHRFVTMAVEDHNHVGKMGVAETGPDYDWKKRRS